MTPEELEAAKQHLDEMLAETADWDELTPEEAAFVDAQEEPTDAE